MRKKTTFMTQIQAGQPSTNPAKTSQSPHQQPASDPPPILQKWFSETSLFWCRPPPPPAPSGIIPQPGWSDSGAGVGSDILGLAAGGVRGLRCGLRAGVGPSGHPSPPGWLGGGLGPGGGPVPSALKEPRHDGPLSELLSCNDPKKAKLTDGVSFFLKKLC